MILLLVIFFGSAARQTRLELADHPNSSYAEPAEHVTR
jgi:hypothetical protein